MKDRVLHLIPLPALRSSLSLLGRALCRGAHSAHHHVALALELLEVGPELLVVVLDLLVRELVVGGILGLHGLWPRFLEHAAIGI